MNFATKGPPHGHVGGPLEELSSLAGVDDSDLKPLRSNGQIKFQTPAETDFDIEIALDLAASHWRTAALFSQSRCQIRGGGRRRGLDGRAAFGRSLGFRLSETTIEELVDVALQLERRA